MFASRSPHCLYDLLLAHQLKELGGDLVAVVSNHEDLRSVAGHFGVRFEHIPIDAGDKPRAEAAAQRLLGELSVDLVVLARYMQVLTPEFVSRCPRASSTFTIRSCPRSSAPSRTTRRRSAA